MGTDLTKLSKEELISHIHILEHNIGVDTKRIEELEKENKYLRDENAIYKNETISKSVIRDKIIERQFELQQEYEDFENDIRLNTLIEILGEE